MFRKPLIAAVVSVSALVTSLFPGQSRGEDDGNSSAIDLSPALMKLLRAEMSELAGGVQSIALHIATADWKAVGDVSDKMHRSYIMKKSLTKAQGEELKRKLPAEFKQLDAAFHARAKQLKKAAVSKDESLRHSTTLA